MLMKKKIKKKIKIIKKKNKKDIESCEVKIKEKKIIKDFGNINARLDEKNIKDIYDNESKEEIKSDSGVIKEKSTKNDENEITK